MGIPTEPCEHMLISAGSFIEHIDVVIGGYSETGYWNRLIALKAVSSDGKQIGVGNIDDLEAWEEKFQFDFTKEKQLIGVHGTVLNADSNTNNTVIASIGFYQNICFEDFEYGVTNGEVLEIIVFVLFILLIVPAICFLLYFCLSNRGTLFNKKGNVNENTDRTIELPSRLDDSDLSNRKLPGAAVDLPADSNDNANN